MENTLLVPRPQRSAKALIVHDNISHAISDFTDGKFQLVITSPPYNIGKSYEQRSSLEEYLSWQEEVIKALTPKIAACGSIVWQVGNYVDKGEIVPLDICFYPIFKKLGFKLRNRIVWHFDHGLHCAKRLSGRYETALWFTKSDNYIFNLDAIRVPSKYPGKLYYRGPKKGQPSGNPLGKNPSDYWNVIATEFEDGIIDIPNVKCNHPEKTTHPCQFPVELAERFILALTNEYDEVFDPFGGVGSTIIAAIKNNRAGVMCEINKEYIDIAKKRIDEWKKGELKTRPIGKKIYVPSGNEKVCKRPEEWNKQGGLL